MKKLLIVLACATLCVGVFAADFKRNVIPDREVARTFGVTAVGLSPSTISDQATPYQITIRAEGFTVGDRITVRMPYNGTPEAHSVMGYVCNAGADGTCKPENGGMSSFATYPPNFSIVLPLGLAPGDYTVDAYYCPPGVSDIPVSNRISAGSAILHVE